MLQHKDIHVGVFSDYPVIDKLRALDLLDRVPLALCATDPAINAFKPHPKGFLKACEFWNLHPEDVLYVGDRPEVDAVGAATAGMSCAILCPGENTGRHRHSPIDYMTFSTFAELQHALSECE